MKNASNGPRGTSPFKSTTILLLPTCHHFSDQKLPARVTFLVRRLTGTPPPLSALPPLPPLPSVRKSLSAYLSLNKARETLLYTGASLAYVFTRCDVGYEPTWRETFDMPWCLPTRLCEITFAILIHFSARRFPKTSPISRWIFQFRKITRKVTYHFLQLVLFIWICSRHHSF